LKIYKNRKLKWNVLSSEFYQNQHKATAALKVDLEVKRKKIKKDVQRRRIENLQKQKIKMEERLEKIKNVIDAKKVNRNFLM
jgi:hypothetical protein